MPKKIFITFSSNDGHSRCGKEILYCEYDSAATRLINQAKSTNYFDKYIHYTNKDLEGFTEFWEKHSEFMKKNKRLYGFAIWKSYIIKKTLEEMNNGDILMYLDCGCEIGMPKQQFIPHFFELVKQYKIISSDTYCPEKEWSKMELLKHLNMENSNLINTTQYASGAILFCKCDNVTKFVDLWYSTCCNYNLINDEPTKSSELECFIENRHDQSVFSLLLKKNNFAIEELKRRVSIQGCIYYIRNRSGISKLNNQ